MKRNVSFWTRYTWETAGVELIAVVALAFLSVLTSSGLQLSLLVSTLPYFLVFAGAFCIILTNSSAQLLYMPLLLSMGETRRNVFLGSIYYRVLVIAVTIALCGLIWVLAPGAVATMGLASIPSFLTILVAFSSVGSIIGTITTRWRWVGVLFLALIGGCVGGASGVVFAGGLDLTQSGVMKLATLLRELPLWAGITAGVLQVLDLGFQALLLRRQEVKL